MLAAAKSKKYTPEEYLALERAARYKSDYFNGYIYAMSGANLKHNQITFNIAAALGPQLKGRACYAYVSDMRVKVSPTGLYTYPDVVALCGTPEFEDSHMDTLINPMAVIEILSDSTEGYDRGEKFAHYRRISTLVEYVLIAQHKVLIETYVRKDKLRVLSEVNDINSSIHLASVECDLLVQDIYDKVEFKVDLRELLIST